MIITAKIGLRQNTDPSTPQITEPLKKFTLRWLDRVFQANKSTLIHTNQILFSSNRLELSPRSFTHVFKKIETTISWNCISKALRFLQITAEHQDCAVFTLFLSKKVQPKGSRERSYRFNLNLTNIEAAIGGKSNRERFPVPRNTAAGEIADCIISLLRQLRCHCNHDHNKFSSLSNTAVVVIFSSPC